MPRKKKPKEIDINDTEIKKELDRGNKNLLIAGIIIFVFGVLTLIIYIGVIFILIAVYLFYLYWERSTDINKYPVIKRMPKENKDVYIKLLDNELKDIKDKSGTSLTDSFIIVKSTFGLKWVHYSQVVWVYQKVTRHSVNFVPTGTSRAICICNTGSMPEILLPVNDENRATDMIKFFMKTVPFAVFGYFPATKNLWNKDRKTFVDNIKKRENAFINNSVALASVKWVRKLKDYS